MTLNDIYKEKLHDVGQEKLQYPMIPTHLIDITKFPYLQEYKNNAIYFDKVFLNRYGILQTDEITETNYDDLIIGMLYFNNEKYTRLWNVYKIQYNPIDNYDGNETEIVTHSARTDTTIYGKKEETNTQGEFDVTTANDERRNTEKVSGFNSTSLVDKTQNIVNSTTDKITNGAITNTNITNSSTDDFLKGEETETRTLNKHGNLGVTSSQNMIEQEKNLWEYFNFYSMIFSDLIDEVTTLIYE